MGAMTRGIVICALCAAACSGEAAEDLTRSATRGTVEVGRGVARGMVEGTRDGRESQESADGARVVSTHEQLSETGSVEISAIEDREGGTVVTLRFSNDGDQPLRIAHLDDGGAVLAIDRDGVAHASARDLDDLTVFPRARQTLSVRFDLRRERIATVRLWGRDLALPSA